MKVSRDRRKWNKLVDRYKLGDNWVELSYDWTCHAWREWQRPWGWSPFGQPKWEEDELAEAISYLERRLELDDWHNNPNVCRGILHLQSLGIIY